MRQNWRMNAHSAGAAEKEFLIQKGSCQKRHCSSGRRFSCNAVRFYKKEYPNGFKKKLFK
jgi:hypothetical protein